MNQNGQSSRSNPTVNQNHMSNSNQQIRNQPVIKKFHQPTTNQPPQICFNRQQFLEPRGRSYSSSSRISSDSASQQQPQLSGTSGNSFGSESASHRHRRLGLEVEQQRQLEVGQQRQVGPGQQRQVEVGQQRKVGPGQQQQVGVGQQRQVEVGQQRRAGVGQRRSPNKRHSYHPPSTSGRDPRYWEDIPPGFGQSTLV